MLKPAQDDIFVIEERTLVSVQYSFADANFQLLSICQVRLQLGEFI